MEEASGEHAVCSPGGRQEWGAGGARAPIAAESILTRSPALSLGAVGPLPRGVWKACLLVPRSSRILHSGTDVCESPRDPVSLCAAWLG